MSGGDYLLLTLFLLGCNNPPKCWYAKNSIIDPTKNMNENWFIESSKFTGSPGFPLVAVGSVLCVKPASCENVSPPVIPIYWLNVANMLAIAEKMSMQMSGCPLIVYLMYLFLKVIIILYNVILYSI